MTQAISKARTLYHFTSIEQWPSIHEAQYLNVVESNISLRRAHVGPEVVWLTTTDRVSRNSHGLAGSRYDKSRIRFTVTVRAERWYDFARAHGIHPKTLAVLNETGGGSAGTWWVCRHRIESRD